MVVSRYCKRCKKEYLFQESGHGMLDESNDPDYCPECLFAIRSDPG
jgi:hypothetical protein